MNPKLVESKGHPLYLQYRFGEYVTRFQLSHQGEPVKIVMEKARKEEEDEQMIRVVKINKAKISFFFSPVSSAEVANFLNQCEIELRLTLG